MSLTVPAADTALVRSAVWIKNPAVERSHLPNVVVVAVIAQESGGVATAEGYNCIDGRVSMRPCLGAYGVQTSSVDAGLMQINSGGWPATPKWDELGLETEPFDPTRNIAAGVSQLESEMRKYGYLKYALEAYNAGYGGPESPAAPYATAVLHLIRAYERGPSLGVWLHGGWIVAAGAAPLGRRYSVPWAPGKVSCRTRGQCHRGPPVYLKGWDLVLPSKIVVTRSSAGGDPRLALSADAPLALRREGATIWTVSGRKAGTYRFTALWSAGFRASFGMDLTR